jgi:tetratricopeptide (TPR) repeat protein
VPSDRVGYNGNVTPFDTPHEPAAGSQLGGLTDTAIALGRLAAVLGPSFTLAELQAIAERPPDTFAPALAELVGAGVLAVADHGYRFVGEPARVALYEALDPADRQRAHAAAARHLEAQPGSATLAAIARHRLAAGDDEAAPTDALKAGQALAAAGDHAGAEAMLEAGLALVKQSGRAAWGRLRLDHLAALADLWRLTGKLSAARAAYQEALQLVEALDEPSLAGPLLVSLAQIHQGLDEWVEAERLGDRAVVACLNSGDRPGAARALLTATRIRLHLGRLDEAHAQASRALAIAREAEDASRLAEALALMGYMHSAVHPKRLEEGVACLHESIAILSAQQDHGGLLLSYMLLGNAQLAMGDGGAAARAFAIARWIAQDTGNATEEGIALINMTLASLELGRLDEALGFARDARERAAAMATGYQAGLAAAVEALALAHLGRLDAADAALAEAEARCLEADVPYMAALVWQWTLEARLLLGDAPGALAAGERLAEVSAAPGHAEGEARAHALMAEALGRTGDRAAAMAAARMALAAAETARAPGDQARALRVLAWLMAEEGDREGARRFAEHAGAMARRLGAAYQVALIEGLLAELARRDEPEAATGHHRAMGAIADEMGCLPLKAQALAGLGELEEARRLLEGLLAGASVTNRQHFLSFPERRRVLRSAGTGPLDPGALGL